MKDVNELSKLVADMVCKSLLQIIGENINSGAIVENCQTDEAFKEDLFFKLKQAFPSEFASGDEVTKEQVTSWFEREDVHRQDFVDVLSDSGALDVVSEEIEDDVVENWFENADYNDIVNRCSPGQESDLEDYFLDNFKERAKDAIDNM